MEVLVLTADDIRKVLPMEEAIAACERAYAAYSSGRAEVPLRTQLPVPGYDGVSIFMPALLREGEALGLKVVSVYPRNPGRGLPSVVGLVVLLDVETGVPLAVMEGGYLTALRTGAAAAVAARYLAREDASVAALFGAGAQARTQVLGLAEVRPLREVRVYDPLPGRAQALAGELGQSLPGVTWVFPRTPREAVAGAHVVVTATTSPEPVFPGESLEAGTHVSAIGAFTPGTRELDGLVLERASKVVVDSREAALAEAGDLVMAIAEGRFSPDRIHAEVGEIVLGRKEGRRHEEEITIYKAVGIAVLDLACARAAWEAAAEREAGTRVRL